MQSAATTTLVQAGRQLADRYGFALLMPEQSRRNNLSRSFNWFQRNDTQRGEGEAHSIAQMVEQMVRDHDIDRRRDLRDGLSAGGAMTLALLATYPMCSRLARSLQAFLMAAQPTLRKRCAACSKRRQNPPASWAICEEASPNRKSGRSCPVWHGSADKNSEANEAGEIIKQWLDVRELRYADVRPNCRRAFSASLVECRWRDGNRILHNHDIGARHPSSLIQKAASPGPIW